MIEIAATQIAGRAGNGELIVRKLWSLAMPEDLFDEESSRNAIANQFFSNVAERLAALEGRGQEV